MREAGAIPLAVTNVPEINKWLVTHTLGVLSRKDIRARGRGVRYRLMRAGAIPLAVITCRRSTSGVTLTARESHAVAGLLHTLGVLSRKDIRAHEDAECVRLMREAGAIPLAVTNVPEINKWRHAHSQGRSHAVAEGLLHTLGVLSRKDIRARGRGRHAHSQESHAVAGVTLGVLSRKDIRAHEDAECVRLVDSPGGRHTARCYQRAGDQQVVSAVPQASRSQPGRVTLWPACYTRWACYLVRTSARTRTRSVTLTARESHAVAGLLHTLGVLSRKDIRAHEDAECVRLMREAGAIPLAVTNVPEINKWFIRAHEGAECVRLTRAGAIPLAVTNVPEINRSGHPREDAEVRAADAPGGRHTARCTNACRDQQVVSAVPRRHAHSQGESRCGGSLLHTLGVLSRKDIRARGRGCVRLMRRRAPYRSLLPTCRRSASGESAVPRRHAHSQGESRCGGSTVHTLGVLSRKDIRAHEGRGVRAADARAGAIPLSLCYQRAGDQQVDIRAHEDAECVRLMREAGAIPLAVTNVPEINKWTSARTRTRGVRAADARAGASLLAVFNVPEINKCHAVASLLHTLGVLSRKDIRAHEDAECVRLMREAGAIPLAVTNVPEINKWARGVRAADKGGRHTARCYQRAGDQQSGEVLSPGVTLTARRSHAVAGLLHTLGVLSHVGHPRARGRGVRAAMRAGAIPLAVTNVPEINKWWCCPQASRSQPGESHAVAGLFTLGVSHGTSRARGRGVRAADARRRAPYRSRRSTSGEVLSPGVTLTARRKSHAVAGLLHTLGVLSRKDIRARGRGVRAADHGRAPYRSLLPTCRGDQQVVSALSPGVTLTAGESHAGRLVTHAGRVISRHAHSQGESRCGGLVTLGVLSRKDIRAHEDAECVRLMREAGAIPLAVTNVPEINKWESHAVAGLLHTLGVLSRKDIRAHEDAECVRLMREAGAIPLAVTNVPEINKWMEARNYVFGQTNNPHHTGRTAGGSSGGEAALHAAVTVPISLCSDIGGSTRMPAFFNGLYALNPTPGHTSLKGSGLRTGDEPTMAAIGFSSRHPGDLGPLTKIVAGDKAHLLNLDRVVDVKKLKFYFVESSDDWRPSPICADQRNVMKKAIAKLTEDAVSTAHVPQQYYHTGFNYMFLLWRYWMTHEVEDFASMITNRKSRASFWRELAKKVHNHTITLASTTCSCCGATG
ncbi:unnamed protein product [Chrysodeixis includens]|uniref:Amidase domain-containing protein n=1 Tax=Chrysodeixis includens TaxID=689277 RepID=A0A9N8L3T1_CHRIL|nr:unnamed protein product [Chrysodeixis includens]